MPESRLDELIELAEVQGRLRTVAGACNAGIADSVLVRLVNGAAWSELFAASTESPTLAATDFIASPGPRRSEAVCWSPVPRQFITASLPGPS
jgi:hypothetical protein